MSTPPPDSVRERHGAALDELAGAGLDDARVQLVLDTGRALLTELAGGDPLFAGPSTESDP